MGGSSCEKVGTFSAADGDIIRQRRRVDQSGTGDNWNVGAAFWPDQCECITQLASGFSWDLLTITNIDNKNNSTV